MEMIKRIKQRMVELGLSKAELQKLSGIKKSTFYNVFDDKTNTDKINIETLSAIAVALNTPMDYFVYGETNNTSTDTPHPELRPFTTKRFRVIGDIACGTPIEANEEYELYVDACADIKADYVFKARGDSMVGARIHDGDYVFIKACEEAQHRGIYAISLNGEITLKRVLFHPVDNPMIVSLRAENPNYEDVIISDADLETFRVIGKCIAFQSDIK